MRKLFLHVFTAAVMFSFGLGLTKLLNFQPSTAPSVPQKEEQRSHVTGLNREDEKQIRAIYREYGPAQTRQDRAFFERVEADNFILFRGDKNLTREEDIQWMLSWSKDLVYELEVESLKFVGDAAVVTGKVRERYPDGFINTWGFIDVCIREGNTWRILSTTSLN